MFYNILVQAIGFIAIAVNILAVQFNSHGLIMLFKSIGSFLFCIQYLLLSAYTGLVMDLIGVIRNFIFAYNVKKGRSNKLWIVIFSILTAGLGIATIILTWSKTIPALTRWSSDTAVLTVLAVFISVISIVAKLLTTIGYGAKDPHKVRMINLPSFSLWILYNITVLSIAGAINDGMSIISILIAEYRFRKKPDKPSAVQPNKETTQSIE